ncbi:MAG: hypothetical protein RI993_1190 [Pseudomonadota bacterium]|nr:DUF1566 domain-containing protein [Nitrosomonas sp.]
MNKKPIASLSKALCAGMFLFGLVSTANAALISRLGGLAVYDTDLDITWLADANAGAGSTFDDGVSSSDGRMTWGNANAWAASLNVGGVTGWRLPTTQQPDPSCGNQSGDAIPQGFGSGCTGSEMGHLFNEEGITANAPGVFSNVQSLSYWSGTEFAPVPVNAWLFNFNFGIQFADVKDLNLFAWAVHSGDVGASSVPEPGTIALMGLGLLGLLGFGRRQRRR